MVSTNKRPISQKALAGFAALPFGLIGLIFSIIALFEIKQKGLRGKTLAIIGIIFGAFFGAMQVYLIVWFFLPGDRRVENEFKKYISSIEQINSAQKGCEFRYGTSNAESIEGYWRTPTYVVYYRLPDDKDLTSRIKSISFNEGYPLSVDRNAIEQIKWIRGKYFNQDAEYLNGSNNGRHVGVIINHKMSMAAVECKDDEFEKKWTGDAAIVQFEFALPPIR